MLNNGIAKITAIAEKIMKSPTIEEGIPVCDEKGRNMLNKNKVDGIIETINIALTIFKFIL